MGKAGALDSVHAIQCRHEKSNVLILKIILHTDPLAQSLLDQQNNWGQWKKKAKKKKKGQVSFS